MRPVILGLLAAAALAGPTMGAECQKALIPDEVAVSSDLMVNYALAKHVLSSTDQQTRKKWDGAFNAGSINGLFRSKTAQEFVQRVEAYTNESLGAVEVEQRLEREMSPGAWDAYTTCILSQNAILTAIPYKKDPQGELWAVRYIAKSGFPTKAVLKVVPEDGEAETFTITSGEPIDVRIRRPKGKDLRAGLEIHEPRAKKGTATRLYNTAVLWIFTPRVQVDLVEERERSLNGQISNLESGPEDGRNRKVEVLKAAPGYVVLPNSVTTSLNATTAYGQCIDWTATKATPEVSAKLVTWTVTSKPTGRSCPTHLVYALGFNEARAKVSLIDRGDPYKVIQ